MGRAALLFTPVGAFAPVVTGVKPASGSSATGLQVRYSHWQFAADDDNTTNIGGGLVLQRRGVRTLLEIGYASKKDCEDCDNLMFGVDVNVPVIARNAGGETNLLLSLNPAFGYGKPTDSGSSVSALAAALSVPMSASLAMVSGGVALAGATTPLQLTLSARRILIEDGPTVYGVAFAFTR